ncbi:hypothetical protein HZC30_03600 [Candidatus Woesearchaeota archaeon]|nr:hypothetical protein [Candidatus Woesearchaeota archaeon]
MAEINPQKILDNYTFGFDQRIKVGERALLDFFELGSALGQRLVQEDKRRIVVAGDGRVTTPALKHRFWEGLCQHDVNTIDLGHNLPTPLAYAGLELYGADAVAVITASHSSWEWNGIKINIIKNRDSDGDGEDRRKDYSKSIRAYGKDVKKFYQALLQQGFGGGEKLTVAIDPLWGAYSDYAAEVLRSCGHTIICNEFLHNGIRGFPDDLEGYSSDPHKEKNLEHLIETVTESFNLDFGAAFDGDGDRVKFIDDQGEIVSEDEVTAIIASYLISAERCAPDDKKQDKHHQKKSKVVAEIKSSKLVKDIVEDNGGELVREQTGRVYIKETMAKDPSIVFAGELSGHYFYRRELAGKPFYFVDTGEDGLFTLLLLGKILNEKGKKLSELRAALPKYETSGEIRYTYRKGEEVNQVKPEIEKIIRYLTESYAQDRDNFISIIRGDDVRIESTCGDYRSVVFRSSKNDPQKFTLVFEGKTAGSLREIKEDFLQKIHSGGYTCLEKGLGEVLNNI